MKSRWLILFAVLFAYANVAGEGQGPLALRTNDIVGLLGGGDVASAQHSGHLESLWAIANGGNGVRFRNFGWEGDTVFEQPRDVGFPSLSSNLEKAGVTVVVAQFGRGEALSGKRSVAEFREAYAKLADEFSRKFRQVIFVTPTPFEKGGGLLPDVSKRNPELAERAEVIRGLAWERKFSLIDVFDELTKHPPERLTLDGVQLTQSGHADVARAFVRRAGLGEIAERAGPAKATGEWRDAKFERVRQGIIEKNRLWFDYSRPQNWAFLGGDRTTQPSSRDHRDPKVRWFPAEMEKFLPLIKEAERRIEELAVVAARKP